MSNLSHTDEVVTKDDLKDFYTGILPYLGNNSSSNESSKVEGYLNSTDGKFYEESTYDTEITGDTDKIYVSLDTDYIYRYDSTNGFTQIGGSSGGGHTILDSEDTEMTQRANLKFGGDFEVSDNSTDDETEIAPHELTNEDMAEIMSTLPSPVKHGVKYSLQEQVIGEWIDGKPLYQKTVEINNPSVSWSGMSLGITNVDMTILHSVLWFANTSITCYSGSYYNVANDYISFMAYTLNNTATLICKKSDTNLQKIIVTVQYTKTTDTV